MIIKKAALLLSMVLIPVIFALAEGPGGPGSGPNGNGSPSGNGGIPVGGNAPVGSGIVVMVLSACAYGLTKNHSMRNKKD